MTLYEAILDKANHPTIAAAIRDKSLHVKTCDGKLGTVLEIYRNETRCVRLAKLHHFNGEPFDQDYALTALEIIRR